MDQHTKKHVGYYLSLIGVLLVGLVGIYMVGVDNQLRMTIVMAMATFSIFWGVLHHYIHHDITAKIVLEYVLIGSVAISLAFLVLN